MVTYRWRQDIKTLVESVMLVLGQVVNAESSNDFVVVGVLRAGSCCRGTVAAFAIIASIWAAITVAVRVATSAIAVAVIVARVAATRRRIRVGVRIIAVWIVAFIIRRIAGIVIIARSAIATIGITVGIVGSR